MNEFTLSGIAMGTPEVKTTDAGLVVGELVLGVKKTFKTKDGNDEIEMIKVNLFKKLAEDSEDIVDGMPLIVKGHIYSNNVTKDGKISYYSNIVADRIEKIN